MPTIHHSIHHSEIVIDFGLNWRLRNNIAVTGRTPDAGRNPIIVAVVSIIIIVVDGWILVTVTQSRNIVESLAQVCSIRKLLIFLRWRTLNDVVVYAIDIIVLRSIRVHRHLALSPRCFSIFFCRLLELVYIGLQSYRKK